MDATPFWTSMTFNVEPVPAPEAATAIGRHAIGDLMQRDDLCDPLLSSFGDGRFIVSAVVDATDADAAVAATSAAALDVMTAALGHDATPFAGAIKVEALTAA